MITEHFGDLFTSDAPAIGHGVNCKGVMGAGIARIFRDKYPDMYSYYKECCTDYPGLKPGECLDWKTEDGKYVLNIASQDEPGANAKFTYLIAGLANACIFLKYEGINRFAIPRIGCGIGGLNWGNTRSWIWSIADAYDMHIEVWSL